MAKDPKSAAEPDAKTAIPLTNEQQVRLECAKLAYRHDRTAQDTVKKADELAQYVLEGKAAPDAKGTGGQGALL